MDESKFIRYVGDYRIHDSKITLVRWDGNHLDVQLNSPDGETLFTSFKNVKSIKSNKPIGMMIYALSEMEDTVPYRKFIFANWDEDDDSILEIVAMDFQQKS